MLPSTYARGIPTYDSLSYSNFLVGAIDVPIFPLILLIFHLQHDHLIPNTPFLLSQSSTSRWRASKKWRVDTSSSGSTSISQPILSSLRPYAYHIVPIADTCVREYSEFARSERLLGDILDLWERGDGGELYVKDWHLPSAVEQEGRGVEEIYEVPEPFRGKSVSHFRTIKVKLMNADDWMNPAYSPSKTNPPQPQPNDFRFCYVGPPGTFTPLHRDVYASYSWSANIVGRKKWWLFPPDTLHSVRDTSGKLVFDVREMPDEGGGIKIVQQVSTCRCAGPTVDVDIGRRGDIRAKWMVSSSREPGLCEFARHSSPRHWASLIHWPISVHLDQP